MEQELLKEVSSIKKWIASAVVMLFLLIASITALSVWSIYVYKDMYKAAYQEERREEKPWYDPAYDAIEEAKYDSALSLADMRLKTHPNDADAFYIKAKIAYYQGDEVSAKMYLLHTKALAPSWDAEHIKPLQEAIEEKAFNREFKAVPPAPDAASGTP